MILIFIINKRTMRRLALTTLTLTFAFAVVPALAQGIYMDTRQVLGNFFQSSDAVSYVTIDRDAVAGELHRRLGYLPQRPQYVIYVAKTDGVVDGYAIVDEELGQHLPITFAIQIDPQGSVVRTEIMAYREAYGEEIRQNRFREQFNGKLATDVIRTGHDVVAISGATISSRSMTRAVKRALVLVDLLRTGYAQPLPKS